MFLVKKTPRELVLIKALPPPWWAFVYTVAGSQTGTRKEGRNQAQAGGPHPPGGCVLSPFASKIWPPRHKSFNHEPSPAAVLKHKYSHKFWTRKKGGCFFQRGSLVPF